MIKSERHGRVRSVRAYGLLLNLLVVTACGSEQGSRASFVVEDSAGIAIATSARPAWESDGWSLSEQPVLQIGVIDGDSAYQLFRVRGAVRLSDGRIAIANDGSSEIRYFDGSGAHIRSVGGSGRGPGEFMSVSVLIPFLADSLIAGDFGLGRTTLLAPAGDVVRTEPGPPPVGALSDGSLVMQTHAAAPLEASTVVHDGPTRDQATLVRYRLGDPVADTLALLPGNESAQVVESDGTNSGITRYRRPFGLMRLTSTYGNSIFTADGSAPEIRVLDATGSLSRLIRYEQALRPVTSADESAYRDRFLEPIPLGIYRERAERALGSGAFPEFMPAFQRLLHDRVGNLWVEEYQADPSESPRWEVFDSDGRWLGSVATRAGLRITDIGEDYVLGVELDDLDVEVVRMYALRKD